MVVLAVASGTGIDHLLDKMAEEWDLAAGDESLPRDEDRMVHRYIRALDRPGVMLESFREHWKTT